VTSYYIYYKVSPERAPGLRDAVTRLQQAIEKKTGIAGRLLCRRDSPETWMEIYEDVADGTAFEAALDAELARLRFAELLGPKASRFTEAFRPL
jgi:hypothetical protein